MRIHSLCKTLWKLDLCKNHGRYAHRVRTLVRMDNNLISQRQLAKDAGIGEPTVRKYKDLYNIPPSRVSGNKILYDPRLADVFKQIYELTSQKRESDEIQAEVDAALKEFGLVDAPQAQEREADNQAQAQTREAKSMAQEITDGISGQVTEMLKDHNVAIVELVDTKINQTADLLNRLVESERHRGQLEGALQTMQLQLAEAQKAQKLLPEKVEALQEQELKAVQLQSQLKQLELESGTTQKDLAQAKEQQQRYEQSLHLANQTVEQKEAQLKEMERERERMRTELEALQAEKESLQADNMAKDEALEAERNKPLLKKIFS